MQSTKHIQVLIDKKYFKHVRIIGRSSYTSKVIQIDTNDEYAMKILKNCSFSTEDEICSFCEELQNNNYHCFLPPSYVIFDKDDGKRYLLYQYKQNQSLKEFIEQKKSQKLFPQEQIRIYKILYGIGHFLELFHSDERVHGNLKLSNVLLDENFLPLVTDSLFINTITNQFKPDTTEQNENLVSCLSEKQSSDILCFGILIIQLLANKIIDLSEENQNEDEKMIKEALSLVSSLPISNEFTKKLKHSLSINPSERPKAVEIKDILGQELKKLIDQKQFNDFARLIIPEKEIPNPKIQKIEIEAKNGNINSIFKFGCFNISSKFSYRKKIGMDYIRYAANNNHIKAQNVYDYYRKDISKFISKSIAKSAIKHLINDSSFDTNFEFSKVLEKIKKGLFDISTFDIDNQFFKEFNFIPTEDALKRLAIIKMFIETGTHLIIEGPTGTSKTFSIEIVCKYLPRNLIRVNLSSDTKSSNLTANIANKQDEWSSIGIDKGPFLQAYENGDVLLLDEINLANPECVRFINDTLDHDQISTQFNGEDIIIEKNPNFVLIATQNPNKGSYSNKRKDLPEDFKSRFIIIEFPELSEKELTEIAKGLAKKHNYEDEEVVKKLVEFHIEWSKENTNDILCFTIREIASTIQAIASGDYSFDAIMNIYGARYEVEKQKKLEQLINRKYPIFKRSKNAEFNYFSEIPNCKKNSSLSKVFNSLWSSIKRGRHVIVASKSGNGATFIAREFAHWYQKKHSFSGSYREHFHVCTIDTNNSYLIGKNKPSEKLNSKNHSNQLIEWHDGFLIKAIKDENIAIFDNIDEALPTILERLNSLLDKKVGEKFETFENPNEKEIEITEGFRLLCTCKLENLEKLSPAFVNRFDVIVLGDQIERNKDSLEDLITVLLKQAHEKLSKPIDDENQTKTDSDSDDDNSVYDNDDFSFKLTKKK